MSTDRGAATAARIRSALALADRQATIHDVKRAVIDGFERVDKRVRIHATDFFRHSSAPDLVLSWPDPVDRPERSVFLRSKIDAAHLLADLDLVARDQPIIFALPSGADSTDSQDGSTDEVLDAGTDQSQSESLQARASSSGTLVTDPAGLDALGVDQGVDSPEIPELVSRLIIRGGRGVYDEAASAATTSSITTGFVAAFAVDPAPTFAAADSIRTHLGQNTGERLLRLLHAIWVASGGRSDQFPDAPDIEGHLSDDALQLLITGPEIQDPQFWARLGELSLHQLGRIEVADRPPNLTRLVLANADSITGRWCRVRPDEPRTGESPGLKWGIERGTLALHGSTFTAFFAEEKRDLDGIEPAQAKGIAVDELTRRASIAEADVSDMTASGGGLTIGVASETRDSVLDNPNVSASVGVAAGNLTKATATLRNGKAVLCDFQAATAASRTRARLTLRELARHGLPLVWPLVDDDAVALQEMVSPVAALEDDEDNDGVDQPSLFDLLDDSQGGDDDAAER